MSLTDTLIAVAGWEDRFGLGIEADLLEYRPRDVCIIVFDEFEAQTRTNRTRVEQRCQEEALTYREIRACRNTPDRVWKTLQDTFAVAPFNGREVLVDITTMPREVIWWSFSALHMVGANVSYVYHKPHTYAAGWVTRDTERPRLVYQSSGVSEFGRETCLVLVSGFDTDRASQLIQFFDPAVTLIGAQIGEQFQNQQQNVERHKHALRSCAQVWYFDVDAYSPDHGLTALDEHTASVRQKYNVVLASLGPKLSAVALYHLHQKYPSLALAYAASRQFNALYSEGIGDAVRGTVRPMDAR